MFQAQLQLDSTFFFGLFFMKKVECLEFWEEKCNFFNSVYTLPNATRKHAHYKEILEKILKKIQSKFHLFLLKTP